MEPSSAAATSAGPAPSATARTLHLACEPRSVSQARRALRETLTGDAEQWLEAAELACSEVVTNGVLHAHTALELTIDATDERLVVRVRDFNPQLPVQRSYTEQATTGRGMALVAALTDEHGVERHDDGKTVWFSLSGTAAEQSEEDLIAAWDDAQWDLGDLVTPPPLTAGARGWSTVRLLALPPLLWLAARQHHDALVRELTLHLAAQHEGGPGVDVVVTDRARATISTAVVAAVELAQREGTARRVLPPGHPSPLPEVPARVDLHLDIPPDLEPAFAVMQDTLDAAERLAEQGRLLTRPGLPEIVAVRDWACEQITAQLAGVSPTPWPGVAQERFTREVNDRDSEPAVDDAELAVVREADRGLVAADDSNRILAISRPLAAALGWEVEELVGRRVVTLIPAELREAHVAGFTRALTTGEHHVLDTPLELPVLRRDGSEVQASFLVQQVPTGRGRTLYLAWIEPLGSPPSP